MEKWNPQQRESMVSDTRGGIFPMLRALFDLDCDYPCRIVDYLWPRFLLRIFGSVLPHRPKDSVSRQ